MRLNGFWVEAEVRESDMMEIHPSGSIPMSSPSSQPPEPLEGADQGPHDDALPAAILGRAVRDRRRRLGLRQLALADLAGVGVAFVYDLEHGKPTLRLDKVLAVLSVLGLGLVVEASGVLMAARLDDGAVPRGENGSPEVER